MLDKYNRFYFRVNIFDLQNYFIIFVNFLLLFDLLCQFIKPLKISLKFNNSYSVFNQIFFLISGLGSKAMVICPKKN